jgi:hypothetical protein
MNEKFEVNLMQPRTQSRASVTIWSCVTGITTFVCLMLALASAKFMRPFQDLFQGLNVELPWPTRLLFATYHWLLPAFYLSLAIGVFAIQFSDRDFRTKRLVTVRIFLAALVGAGFVIFILYLPVLTVASKLVNTN